MKKANVAIFKYEHDDPLERSSTQLKVLAVLALAALCCFFIAIPLGVFAAAGVAVYALIARPKKLICVTPRYLICGRKILYYRNVRKLVLVKKEGQLSVFFGDGKSLMVEQKRFPTNARKPDKIKKNKAAKFDKVSGKIIQKVLTSSPKVELVGINRSSFDVNKGTK